MNPEEGDESALADALEELCGTAENGSGNPDPDAIPKLYGRIFGTDVEIPADPEAHVGRALGMLSPLERDVAIRRFGLNGRPSEIFRKIVAEEGVSQEQAAYAFRMAMEKLGTGAYRTEMLGNPAKCASKDAEEVLSFIPIRDMDLPTAEKTVLRKNGIRTASDLMRKSDEELLSLKGFGEKMLMAERSEEIRICNELGIDRGGAARVLSGE